MKKIYSIIVLGLLSISTYAARVMCVKTDDGNISRFDVEYISSVRYKSSPDVSGMVGNYSFVDLGLPSGTKWATYNVGATQPTEMGDRFAWGEIVPKQEYTEENYLWNDSTEVTTLISCDSSDLQNQNKRCELSAEYDVAVKNWGNGWRMPRKEELQELIDGCVWNFETDFMGTGVFGAVGISKTNDNMIFFPIAVQPDIDNIHRIEAYYWSTSLYFYDEYAECLFLYPHASYVMTDYSVRNKGFRVRPVFSE